MDKLFAWNESIIPLQTNLYGPQSDKKQEWQGEG